MQMLSKYLQQYYTHKCLTRDLLSNIIFSQNSDLPMLNIFHMAGMGKRRGTEGREKRENEKSTNMLCGICIFHKLFQLYKAELYDNGC